MAKWGMERCCEAWQRMYEEAENHIWSCVSVLPVSYVTCPSCNTEGHQRDGLSHKLGELTNVSKAPSSSKSVGSPEPRRAVANGLSYGVLLDAMCASRLRSARPPLLGRVSGRLR